MSRDTRTKAYMGRIAGKLGDGVTVSLRHVTAPSLALRSRVGLGWAHVAAGPGVLNVVTGLRQTAFFHGN